MTEPDSAERSHRPRVISLPNSLLRTFAPLNTHPDPRQVPYQIPEPPVALFSPKTADEIRVEANPPLLRVFVTVSDLPIFPLLLRSRRSSPFAISCSLCFPNPRRTPCRNRRPPSSVASAPEPLPDIVLALGEFALSSTTPRCFRFAF